VGEGGGGLVVGEGREGGIGVAMMKGARDAIPGTPGPTSAEVESWFLGSPVLGLRVDVPRVPASVRVPPRSPRRSDWGRRGAVRGGGASPSPLAVPRDPVVRVGVLRWFACARLPSEVFGSSAAQFDGWGHAVASGRHTGGLVVAVVVKVPQAPAPVRVSPRASRGSNRAGVSLLRGPGVRGLGRTDLHGTRDRGKIFLASLSFPSRCGGRAAGLRVRDEVRGVRLSGGSRVVDPDAAAVVFPAVQLLLQSAASFR